MFDTRFKNPCSFLLAGPSQAGKTTFTLNVLRDIDNLFVDPRCKQNIIFFYNKWQDAYDSFKTENIVKEWINILPTAEMIKEKTLMYEKKGGSILIIDDFADEITKDIVDLYTGAAHHYKCVAILLAQNLFSQAKGMRQVSINSTYAVVFKNPRDSAQISFFARQFSPHNSRYVIDAYYDATRNAHSYLFFDFHQKTPTELRIRTNVLRHEWPMYVYQPKNNI